MQSYQDVQRFSTYVKKIGRIGRIFRHEIRPMSEAIKWFMSIMGLHIFVQFIIMDAVIF